MRKYGRHFEEMSGMPLKNMHHFDDCTSKNSPSSRDVQASYYHISEVRRIKIWGIIGKFSFE